MLAHWHWHWHWPLLNTRSRSIVGVVLLCACLIPVCAGQQTGRNLLPARGQGCALGWKQALPVEKTAGCQYAAAQPTVAATRMLAEQVTLFGLPAVQGPLQPSVKTTTPTARAATPKSTKKPPLAPLSMQVPSAVASPATARPFTLAPLIDQTARSHNIDPLLLHAIARVESRHQPGAVSRAGAHGLMQIIAPTAQRFGVDTVDALYDPQTNLWVSARYLKNLQQRFGNNLPLVLAAYNAGEGAVEKYGLRVPPYPETQGYVRQVLSEYQYLRRIAYTQYCSYNNQRHRFMT